MLELGQSGPFRCDCDCANLRAYPGWDSPRKERPVTAPDDSLRVSDAERDQTLRVLGEHAAVGRLTLDELEERSSRALAAKTRGELATLTGDLPQEAGQDRPAPTLVKKPVRWMVAIMSGSHRRGRFRAVGSINSIS